MKKNFLLLLLMALLPLAGWAADLSKGTIVAPSPYFGNTPDAITVYDEAGAKLTLNKDYTFEGYFSDAEAKTAVAAADIAKKNAGTTLYVKVTGINSYENDLIASFEVKPMPLTITVKDDSKVYGAADPKAFEVTAVADKSGADKTKDLKASVTAGRKGGENAGTYDYTATIAGQANYEIGTVKGTFTIEKKKFVESKDNIAITLSGTYTYNGKDQEATIEVKDGSKVLTKGEKADYVIEFSDNKAAGTATATIKGAGNNYTTDAVKKTFEIAAAPLLVTPAATKVYDGKADLPTKITYTYQGFVDEMTGDKVDASTATVTSKDAKAGVADYALTIDDASKFSLTNYTFLPVEGKFTITKAEVKVTADSKTYNYGDKEELTVTINSGAVSGDETALTNAIKVSKVAADKAGTNLLPEFRTDAEIDALTLDADAKKDAAAKAAAKAAVANYKLTATRGTLKYNNATLNIALNESAYKLDKVYDGQPVSITLDKENGLTILGKKNENDVINLDNLTLTVVSNSANAGTYQLQLSGATADNYDITFIPSQYEIKARPIMVKVYDQTFVYNTALNLNTTLFDIVTKKDKDGNYTQYPIANTDNAGQVFALTTNVIADAKGIITSKNADGPFAITTADAGDKKTPKFANYSITTIDGVATVVDAAITLADTESQVGKAGAKGDEVVSVVFSSRTINPEQWNVLVLPFDVEVKKLAAAFDYAVVDVLDQSASDGNVHFKLQVTGTVAANTPFLIYPSDKYNNLNQIVFEDVTIKREAMKNATVEVKDASGNKFVGTYKETGIYGSDKQYVSKGKFFAATKYTEAAPAKIKPLRAYLDLSGNSNASRATIFIDEPDGTTTAIKAVNAEQMLNVVNAEGWYNMNGVKLQGAPTQKGIYIKNGKKVVVK